MIGENGSGEQRSTLNPPSDVAHWLCEMQCRMFRLEGLATSQVARLLVRVNVPDHIVGQTHNLVARTFCHLGKALGFGLVLEGVCGEIDTYTGGCG